MTSKSFLFTIVFVLLCGVSNVFSQGWEYQLQHDSDNERFYFYDAEEYHQKYLDKNPNGYCHVPLAEIQWVKTIDPMAE